MLVILFKLRFLLGSIEDKIIIHFNTVKESKEQNIERQRGAALVMSLLILSLMMTSAVALSRIILGEVRMATNTINSLSAFYAADSGIEKSLYYIKYTRKNSSIASFDNLQDNSYSLDNGGSFYFVQASTTSPGFIAYDVTTSTPAHVDIVDPSGNISNIDWDIVSGVADSHYYQLTWTIDDCFPFHASDKLEITTTAFSNPLGLFGTATKKDIVICDCSYSTDINLIDKCSDITTTYPISDSNFYRFSFRPLNNTVKSIAFDIYTNPSDGSPDYIVGIASNVAVTVDGIYKNSKYRLKVEVPALAALSDVFSYVIFSEEELKKNL